MRIHIPFERGLWEPFRLWLVNCYVEVVMELSGVPMLVGGVITALLILGLFFSMLGSSPRSER